MQTETEVERQTLARFPHTLTPRQQLRRVKLPEWMIFLRDTLDPGLWNRGDKMPIEVYSKAFSYLSLAMTELVGLFLAVYTSSWAPICFTTFLGVTSFLVSSTFDAEVTRAIRARCVEDIRRAATVVCNDRRQ